MKKIIASILLVSALLIAGCVNKTTTTTSTTGDINSGTTASGTNTVTVKPEAKKGAEVKVAQDQKVQWVAQKIGTTHTGTVDILPESVIQVNTQGNILGGKIVVAMKTISESETKEGGVTKHLLGPDFFDVENHPTAVIEATSVDYTQAEGGNTVTTTTTVTANLTIKGITKVVTFPATLTQDGDFLLLSAKLELNIKDFDLGTSLLGKIALKDIFTIELNKVTFTR